MNEPEKLVKVANLSREIDGKKYNWKLEYQIGDFGWGTCAECTAYSKLVAKSRQLENDWGSPIDPNYLFGCYNCTKRRLDDLAEAGNDITTI